MGVICNYSTSGRQIYHPPITDTLIVLLCYLIGLMCDSFHDALRIAQGHILLKSGSAHSRSPSLAVTGSEVGDLLLELSLPLLSTYCRGVLHRNVNKQTNELTN